jgi:membrane protein implicated in regulation of membrane protease activity
MTEPVRHPRTLAAFRAALYLFAALVGGLLALLGVGVLGALLVVAVVGVATTGDVNLLAIGGLGVVTLVLVAASLLAVSVGTRSVERRVRRADRRPDPVEELTEAYVADDVDEAGLERGLEGLLDDTGDGASRAADRPRAGERRRWVRTVSDRVREAGRTVARDERPRDEERAT